MLSFEAFSPVAGIPIYIQIILHVKRGIAAGTVTDGEEIPSRRVLSALLGINPNTAQKAYRLLEEEGLIESRAGAKSYVRVSAGTVKTVRRELLLREVKGTVYTLKEMGLSREEALAYVRDFWDEPAEQEESHD
jgi:DNA-binding transcriptional regulator YhcF (GntR family)